MNISSLKQRRLRRTTTVPPTPYATANMPKVLAMEEMGNFEVLKWMRDTKKRHETEDEQCKANGLVLKPRPVNLNKAFDKHERHLTREIYPYDSNPSVYNPNYDIDEVVAKLNQAILNRLHEPILQKYQDKVRAQEMTVKEAEKKFEEEGEPKVLSEMELMQLHNLAPTGMETLQLMIEQWEERFTEDEMEEILEAVVEVLRPDELATRKEGG